jgi:hypothetical protein
VALRQLVRGRAVVDPYAAEIDAEARLCPKPKLERQWSALTQPSAHAPESLLHATIAEPALQVLELAHRVGLQASLRLTPFGTTAPTL